MSGSSTVRFSGDDLATAVEFLASQGVVAVQGRDRGGRGVELVVELGSR